MFLEGMKGTNKKLVTVPGPKTLQQAIAFRKTLTSEDDPCGGENKKGNKGTMLDRVNHGQGSRWWPNNNMTQRVPSGQPQGKATR